jgi:hypothetical protein
LGFTRFLLTLREDLPGASECVECVTLILPTPTKDHGFFFIVVEMNYKKRGERGGGKRREGREKKEKREEEKRRGGGITEVYDRYYL